MCNFVLCDGKFFCFLLFFKFSFPVKLKVEKLNFTLGLNFKVKFEGACAQDVTLNFKF